LFVNDTARLSPPERFNSLIDGLFSDITTRATNVWFPLGLAELALIKLIWRRLRRMSRRFAAIMDHYRAGTLAQVGAQVGAQAAPAPDSEPPPATADEPAPDPAAGSTRPHQPSRRSGWVIHAVSYFVMMRHHELVEMLEDPETPALVAAAPQLGSVLRPLCHMLAVKLPAWLRLPHRARHRGPKFPPAPDWVVNQPGAILHADGSVWQRWGASTLWRPGDPGTLEQAQKFDRPRRIWPPYD